MEKKEFLGFVDKIEGYQIFGWAIYLPSPTQPSMLHVVIDGREVGTVVCDQVREDVQAALQLEHEAVGFIYEIPAEYEDGLPHVISFKFVNRTTVPIIIDGDVNEFKEDYTFELEKTYVYQSYVDGFKQGALRGWIQRIDSRTNERLGKNHIRITMDGAPLAQVVADRYRGDVAAVVGGDPNCGFEVIIPPNKKRNGMLKFEFFTIPDGIELGGSPVVTSIIEDQLEGRLLSLQEHVRKLSKEITFLNSEITNLLPKAPYTLGDYDKWARHYFANLKNRVAQDTKKIAKKDQPLVSVICPTYKPEMSDFTAAVESVMSQTYQNWELVIVDDGKKSKEVAKKIEEYTKADSRIKSVILKKNVGIAEATNAGIAAATGSWIAFFDHDDLLEDVAIEVMMNKMLQVNAQVAYSDEDKIDQSGYYLEPNLKPDKFDYRYLLGCNYVCHFLIVNKNVIDKVGVLKTKYNGAQDHDFILRVSEYVPHDKILHVSEILYHWRKTPNSTAVSIGNKDYALKAGIAAVSDHLARLGKKATVTSIRGLTLYDVKWKLLSQPKVSIIIPFKDQADITQECVDRILKHTTYKNYEIILVNNWSIQKETLQFCKKIEKNSKVKIIDVNEEFNYSRLNNLAVAQSDADFYFFMNNDLFIEDKEWLSTIVSEAQSYDDIGIVGGKFFYPNNTIQHLGVVVGYAGIAAHGHRGLADGEYGYIGRAVLSHEVSVVTAAGMLVKAAVYDEVKGFDEVNLKVAYNDVDFCLKTRKAGYRIIQCNNFVAVHHESLSRGSDDRPEQEERFKNETNYMRQKWQEEEIFKRDPAYSRFFTVDLQPYYDLVDPLTLTD